MVDAIVPAESLAPLSDEREPHFAPSAARAKQEERWRLEKTWRPSVHVRDADVARRNADPVVRPAGGPNIQAEARLARDMEPVGTCVQPITTLFNIWNREAMPLIAGQPYKQRFQVFLRDHYTAESLGGTRLAAILAAAAIRFHAPRVDIVSGTARPNTT